MELAEAGCEPSRWPLSNEAEGERVVCPLVSPSVMQVV